MPLFNNPQTEEPVTHLARPIDVPDPIGLRVMDAHLPDYYGQSVQVLVNGAAVDPARGAGLQPEGRCARLAQPARRREDRDRSALGPARAADQHRAGGGRRGHGQLPSRLQRGHGRRRICPRGELRGGAERGRSGAARAGRPADDPGRVERAGRRGRRRDRGQRHLCGGAVHRRLGRQRDARTARRRRLHADTAAASRTRRARRGSHDGRAQRPADRASPDPGAGRARRERSAEPAERAQDHALHAGARRRDRPQQPAGRSCGGFAGGRAAGHGADPRAIDLGRHPLGPVARAPRRATASSMRPCSPAWPMRASMRLPQAAL